MGGDRPKKRKKKFLSRIPFILGPGKKIPNKIAEKSNKLKNLFPSLVLAKTGWDRLRKREKKFQPRILFVTNPSKKIPKKIQKIKKINSGIISIQNGLSEAEKERKKI